MRDKRNMASWLAVAVAVIGTSAANAADFGTDTRAVHFVYSTGFQYAGGYLDDFQEYDVTPNGQTSDTLSTTFSGTLPVTAGVDVPVSAYHFASADLATGKLKAYATDPVVSGGNGQSYFTQGRSNASFADTLHVSFDPSLAGRSVTLGVRTTLDGIYTSGGSASGSGSVKLVIGTTINGRLTGPGGNQGYYNYIFGNNPQTSQNLTNYGGNVYGYDFLVSAVDFDLGIFNLLSVNAYGSTVDYSHTATFGLVLPEGASYTSASGVFLSNAGAGAVPEPASWALMIGGFGFVGGALRRRAGAAASVVVMKRSRTA